MAILSDDWRRDYRNLAEYCEVSARTIQRSEGSEVEPRAFTCKGLSNILAVNLGKEKKPARVSGWHYYK